MYASCNGHEKVVGLLVARGADVGLVDNVWFYSLLISAASKHLSLQTGQTALTLALDHGHSHLRSYLIDDIGCPGSDEVRRTG